MALSTAPSSNLSLSKVNAVEPSLSQNVSSSNNESGVLKSITTTVSYNSEDYELSLVELFEGANVRDSITNVAVSTSGTLSFTGDYSYSVSFSSKLTKAVGGTITRSVTSSFYDPYYHGVLTIEQINSILNSTQTRTAINGLLSLTVTGKSNRTVTTTTNNQRIVLAFPNSYGNLSSVIDQNGYNITSSFNYGTFTYVRQDETTVPYRIYYNDADLNLSNFTVTFNK